jgi:myo-inositol-1(or 4)-monophosphatase
LAANKVLEIHPDMDLLIEAGEAAGRIAMQYFGSTNEVWKKQGDSPVSEADFAVDAYLRETLLKARPHYGWLSEETEDNKDRLERESVFVVDPIDGTRGFLAGRQEWCVSIAVVTANRPVAGVLECPAMQRRFHASIGGGSFLNDTPLPGLACTSLKSLTASRRLNALIERRHGDKYQVVPFVPSLAYRIAMVANREIDAAFARPGAHDWDLAAAEIILCETGGLLTDPDGGQRRYNQPNPGSGSLLACGPGVHTELLELAKADGFLH